MKLKKWAKATGQTALIGSAAFLVGAAFLSIAGVSPLVAFTYILKGALGSPAKISYVIQAWIPLAICACGLIYPFRTGLLNIGVEGQMMWGALCCTAIMRQGANIDMPIPVIILAFLAAAGGGTIWALLAGILKTKGGVNEIFGGLGLNFVAQGTILWLIFGPWKRPGIASMSGTELFSHDLWLPSVMSGRISPVGFILAAIVFTSTAMLLAKTNLGLYLKTVSSNDRAAFLMGLKPDRHILLAMAVSGGCAGLAGAVQVTGVYHCLIPSISGNYGYLALLVVMLANNRIGAAMLIAFFFAGLNVGSIQLPLMMHLDSSLSGVLQGALVLAALAVYSRGKKKSDGSSAWTD
jgi:simple sugar transport system permease protein